MCGIVGDVRYRGAVSRELLLSQRDSMVHRGPDSAGVWIAESGQVGLAHRRLAIIDLSPAGHQPMIDGDTGSVITFNGEIYNFAELRERLQGLGQRFRTHGDTEVILAAYRHWGVECVRELSGMFAFALYDPSNARVLLARDRAGEKPLFYRETAAGFTFASEVKALLEDPHCPRRVSVTSLNEYLAYGYVTGASTIFADIKRVEPGCIAVIDLASCTVTHQKYWQLPSLDSSDSAAQAEELIDELHNLLKNSLRQQLVADVPVGVLLSGGVDSSIVTAIAAEVSSTPLRTFTARFAGHGGLDEGPFAKLVADHLGTIHTELEVPAADADVLQRLVAQFDEPIADSSMIPTFLISQEIRRHATVALGGDGGDELFGGYFRYPTFIRDERTRALVPPIARAAAAWTGERLIPKGAPGRGRLLALSKGMDVSIANAGRIFRSDERAALSAPVAQLASSDLERPERLRNVAMNNRFTPVQRATAVDFSTYMVDDVLAKVDRASMLASLEVRAPFLDTAVTNFAFSRLPDSLRATKTDRKVILRKLGARVLPDGLDLKRKQGFSIPVDDWMRGPWSGMLRAVSADSATSIIAGSAIRDYENVLSKGRPVGNRLFSLMFLRLWERHHKITDVV